jgi:hypothetical protein
MHLHIAKIVQTDKYIIHIYTNDHNINIDNIIDPLIENINSQKYPRGIIESLLPLNGVSLLRIFDLDNVLILTASDVLPEEIDYEQ